MNEHFASLVVGLAHQAEQAIQGRLLEGTLGAPSGCPAGGARILIDTLGMLEEKTRGRLDPDEARLLTEALTGGAVPLCHDRAASVNRRRAALIVLDGVGIGPAPDSARYGDAGSHTLGNVARAVGGLRLPNLERLGLGCCAPLAGVVAVDAPGAACGVARPAGARGQGTGCREPFGPLRPAELFRTYPQGFPAAFVEALARGDGRVGNRIASGTVILDELGRSTAAPGRGSSTPRPTASASSRRTRRWCLSPNCTGLLCRAAPARGSGPCPW